MGPSGVCSERPIPKYSRREEITLLLNLNSIVNKNIKIELNSFEMAAKSEHFKFNVICNDAIIYKKRPIKYLR